MGLWGRDMVSIKSSDRNVVPASTEYVDQGTSLTLQNQDVGSTPHMLQELAQCCMVSTEIQH